MKYNLVIENQLKRLTSLQRVRVKVDPRHVNAESDLSSCPSYEGYVLEEGLSKLKILVMPPDLSIEEIPAELIEFLADEHNENVYEELIVHFINKLGLTEGDPLIQQLLNCSNIDEIEQFVRDQGLEDDQLLEIYKEFILS